MKQDLRTPYLIQRGTIKRPLAKFENERLSNAVDLDYMGSAEFEFGALPKSLRAIEAEQGLFIVRTVPDLTRNYVSLRVASMLTDDQFQTYCSWLHQLYSDQQPIRLKERSGFSKAEMTYAEERALTKVNFWWDIQNHVMWSFDKVFMNRLLNHVANSILLMNKQKAMDASAK